MAYSEAHCGKKNQGPDFQPLWGVEDVLRDLRGDSELQPTPPPQTHPLTDRLQAFFNGFGSTCRDLLSTVKSVSPFHKNSNNFADNEQERRRLLLLRIAAESTQSTWETAPPDNSVAAPVAQTTMSYQESYTAPVEQWAEPVSNSQFNAVEPCEVQTTQTIEEPASPAIEEPAAASSGEMDLAPVAKARLLSHQIAACMLGADPKNSTALAAVAQQFPKFSKGTRLFIEASAVFAGELMGGPGGFKLGKLQRLLDKRGLAEKADRPGVGRVLLNTLGVVAKALEDNELKLMDVLSSRATSDPKRLRLIFEYVNSGRFQLDLERVDD